MRLMRGLVDSGALVVHGAGGVNEEADGDGEVFVAEAGDGLRDAVLVDVEGVLDRGFWMSAAGAVEDGGVEADFVGIADSRV